MGSTGMCPQAEASALGSQAYGVDQSMEDALRFAREAVQGIRQGFFGRILRRRAVPPIVRQQLSAGHSVPVYGG